MRCSCHKKNQNPKTVVGHLFHTLEYSGSKVWCTRRGIYQMYGLTLKPNINCYRKVQLGRNIRLNS
jgi:hypothetical protein